MSRPHNAHVCIASSGSLLIPLCSLLDRSEHSIGRHRGLLAALPEPTAHASAQATDASTRRVERSPLHEPVLSISFVGLSSRFEFASPCSTWFESYSEFLPVTLLDVANTGEEGGGLLSSPAAKPVT